jgi:hypothetical protein
MFSFLNTYSNCIIVFKSQKLDLSKRTWIAYFKFSIFKEFFEKIFFLSCSSSTSAIASQGVKFGADIFRLVDS